MSKVKQVIVMRKDLGMRKGKMVAQGAHASIGALLTLFEKIKFSKEDGTTHYIYETRFSENSVLNKWFNGSFTKICVGVNSEEELLEINKKLEELDIIPFKLITDAGLTEFGGVPTNTCIGIGPYWSDEIDKITGNLQLL